MREVDLAGGFLAELNQPIRQPVTMAIKRTTSTRPPMRGFLADRSWGTALSGLSEGSLLGGAGVFLALLGFGFLAMEGIGPPREAEVGIEGLAADLGFAGAGMGRIWPQLGHLALRPAWASGTCSACEQLLHLKRMAIVNPIYLFGPNPSGNGCSRHVTTELDIFKGVWRWQQ